MLGVARHQHAHEFARFLVTLFAGHDDLVDVLAVEVADRALGERAFLVDQLGRHRFEREIAHRLPQAQQIFEIAFDFRLGAAGAGGAQDHAHALRHFQILGDFLQASAVLGGGDLAADAAAARGVGHQHRIAAGEREIGGERSALGAALFLDDLHQHHLAALDHFLNLVLAAEARRALLHFLQRVGAADGFHRFLFVVVVAVAVLGLRLARRRRLGALRRKLGISGLGGGKMVAGLRVIFAAFGQCFDGFRFDRFGFGRLRRGDALDRLFANGNLCRLAHQFFRFKLGRRRRGRHHGSQIGDLVRRGRAGGGFARGNFCGGLACANLAGFACGGRGEFVCRKLGGFGRHLLASEWLALHHLALARAIGATLAVAIAAAAPSGAVIGVGIGGAGVALFLFDQRLPVGDRNLIVVGMDFGERQEAVAVAAVIDEGRLQRRLDARDLGKIDVTAKLLAVSGLEVEFLDAVAAQHHDPGLLRMGRVDQHFVGHWIISLRRSSPRSRATLTAQGDAWGGRPIGCGRKGARFHAKARRDP